MKNILCWMLAVASLFVVTACGSKTQGGAASLLSGPVAETSSATSEAATKSASATAESSSAASTGTEKSDAEINAKIGFITQEYKGENIAEIPYIKYDGDTNPEIESINRSLNQGIQQVYESFMNGAGSDGSQWIEIKSYPFTSSDYLQVVVTSCVFPSYGTDGDMFSVNFDRKANKALSVSDAMKELGLDQTKLLDKVKQLFKPETAGQSIGKVAATGFLIKERQQGRLVELLLEITVENSESEPWKSFYAYTPGLNELIKLNSSCLFDSSEMDQMNPPLSYQKGTNGSTFPEGIVYKEEYQIEGDPGEGLSAREAAAELIKRPLANIFDGFSAEKPVNITLVGLTEVSEEECYLFDVAGSQGEYRFAVSYKGAVYQFVNGKVRGW